MIGLAAAKVLYSTVVSEFPVKINEQQPRHILVHLTCLLTCSMLIDRMKLFWGHQIPRDIHTWSVPKNCHICSSHNRVLLVRSKVIYLDTALQDKQLVMNFLWDKRIFLRGTSNIWLKLEKRGFIRLNPRLKPIKET